MAGKLLRCDFTGYEQWRYFFGGRMSYRWESDIATCRHEW